MATIKTFRTTGPLKYNDIDDNFDNLNNDKIERLVNVNDSEPAVEITQSGAGEALVVNSDDLVVVNGKVGVGTSNPQSTLDVAGTDGISIPSGTRAQRGTKKATFRYNDDEKTWEGFDGRVWNRFPTPLNIQKITCSGFNGIQVFGDGEIYFTSGINSSWEVQTNGFSDNYYSQVGLGKFRRILIPDSSPVIDAGSIGHYEVSYALCQNGNLYTWGKNESGACGDGTNTRILRPKLVQTNVLEVYTDPSNGGYHVGQVAMLIKKTDGYLYASGWNAFGRFGNGTTTHTNTFIQLTNFGNNIRHAWNLGNSYGSFVVQRNDGTIWMAGYNTYGNFGNGTSIATNSTPINVTASWIPNTGYDIKYIGASLGWYDGGSSQGSQTTFIIWAEDASGNQVVRTAGNSTWGQVGNGTTNDINSTAFNIPLQGVVKDVKLIGGPPTLSILYTNGQLWTWGYNSFGSVGNGNTSHQLSPIQVLTNVKSLPQLGFDSHTNSYKSTSFAVRNDGTLWATGWNEHGQCCVGTQSAVTSYQRCEIPTTQDNTIKIISSYATTGSGNVIVAIREDNEIFGWGYNAHYGVSDSVSSNNVLVAYNFKINRV